MRLTTRPGGGGHGGVGQVQLRLVALSLGLREALLGGAALRLEGLDLSLRDRERRFRIPEGRLLLAQLRSILLGVLHSA